MAALGGRPDRPLPAGVGVTLIVALHVGQLRQPVPGGIGRYVEGLVGHLGGAGAPGGDGGLELTTFGGGRWHYQAWQRLRFPPPWAARGADVVHGPSLAVPPARRRQALVVTVHDLAFLTHPDCFTPTGVAFHTRGLAIARREADVVIVPSRHTGDQLIDACFRPSRVHVVPHGIDPPEPSALPPPPGPYLLFVGTLEPRKGLPVLLEAHGRLRADRPGLGLVVAGPAGWGPAPALDCPGVTAAGKVDEASLDALYRGALATVVPSRTEGFGLPALEAMVRGCPVVCAATGALPEVVGGGGVLVAGGDRDPEALAAALVPLVDDPGERSRWAAAGAARARTFTWAKCVDGHRRAYAAALDTDL